MFSRKRVLIFIIIFNLMLITNIFSSTLNDIEIIYNNKSKYFSIGGKKVNVSFYLKSDKNAYKYFITYVKISTNIYIELTKIFPREVLDKNFFKWYKGEVVIIDSEREKEFFTFNQKTGAYTANVMQMMIIKNDKIYRYNSASIIHDIVEGSLGNLINNDPSKVNIDIDYRTRWFFDGMSEYITWMIDKDNIKYNSYYKIPGNVPYIKQAYNSLKKNYKNVTLKKFNYLSTDDLEEINKKIEEGQDQEVVFKQYDQEHPEFISIDNYFASFFIFYYLFKGKFDKQKIKQVFNKMQSCKKDKIVFDNKIIFNILTEVTKCDEVQTWYNEVIKYDKVQTWHNDFPKFWIKNHKEIEKMIKNDIELIQ